MPANESLLDPEVLRQIREVGGDALLRQVYDTFLENAPRRLEALRAGVEAGDLDRVVRAVHSIRSSAASLGATRLARLAGELEDGARDADRSAVEELVPGLERAYVEMIGHLRLEMDLGPGR